VPKKLTVSHNSGYEQTYVNACFVLCSDEKKHVSKCRLELYIPVNLQTRNWDSMVSILTVFLLYGQPSATICLSLSLSLSLSLFVGSLENVDIAVGNVLD